MPNLFLLADYLGELKLPGFYRNFVPSRWLEIARIIDQSELSKRFGKRYLFLCPRGSGKTTFARSLLLHCLTTIPDFFAVYITSTDSHTKNTSRTVEQAIRVIKRYSPEIAGLLIRYKNRVFHESSDQYIRLLNNSKIAYTSVGSENRGMNIEGRPDLIVVDDILPDEARNSPSTRRNIEDRFLAVIDALGHENTSIFVFGTMIHPDDILSRLEKAGEYTVFKYPIIDENGNSNFIELYPPDRIERLRKHYETMGRLDIWNTEYMLTPVTPDETPFRNAITNFHSNLTIGDKHYAPLGLYRVMAIDHAQGIGGDDFAIVVTGHSPDDKVFLLEEFASNKVGIDGRLGKVIEMAIRYRPNLIVMERTAESLSFIQILRQTLRDRNLLFPFEEVTAKKLGAKNARIYSILSQYVKKLYFPLEGSKTVAELMGFNINKTDNRDDLIDALSLALMHTRKPSLVDTEQPMPSFLKGVQRAIKPAHDIVGQEWI